MVSYGTELSWIEIHSVTILSSDYSTAGKLRVAVEDWRGLEEEKETIAKSDEKVTEFWRTWKLRRKCVAFSNDIIVIRLYRERVLRKDKFLKKFKFSTSSVITEAGDRQDFNCKPNADPLSLTVSLRRLGSVSPLNGVKLGDALHDFKISSMTNGTIQAIHDVFGNSDQSMCVEVMDKAVKTLEKLTGIHPFVGIVIKALLIPYNMWKQKNGFMDHLKALTREIYAVFASIVTAYPATELVHAKDAVADLAKLMLDASEYVEGFAKADEMSLKYSSRAFHHIKRFAAAQFPKKLDDFRTDLRERRLDFREATLVDVLVKSGTLKDRGDDMSYLERKLRPVNLPLVDGCLKGTREAFLSSVKIWSLSKKSLDDIATNIYQMAYEQSPLSDLDKSNISMFCRHFHVVISRLRGSGIDGKRSTSLLSAEEDSNVLWLTGAPGAGKTAMASTVISKVLRHKCAKFFIKRGATDPRTIWPSIAYGLADLSRGVKLDILDILSGDARHAYPAGASIEDQFRQLICGPLKRNFDSTLLKRIVVVIDALDECDMGSREQWAAFLDTIIKWRKEVPIHCKLIVTSRIEADIERRLKSISHPLALDTGDDVSDESNRDIRRLFETGFRDIGVGSEIIEILTRYAAGLFIWATTVIEFVRAGDPEERLQDVLNNMSAVPGEEDKLGKLYGQIIFRIASPRLNRPKEVDRLRLVLASLVLLRRPLSINALEWLFSPEDILAVNHFSRSRQSDISRVVDGLKSVIVTEGNGLLRVRHKSFSDFLLDDRRVLSVLRTLLHDVRHHGQTDILATFSIAQQHALVAKCCLHLMSLSVCTGSAFHQTSTSAALMYSCTYWADHLQCAGPDYYPNSGLHLTPSAEALPALQQLTLRWIEVSSESQSIQSGGVPVQGSDDSLAAQITLNDASIVGSLSVFAATHPVVNLIYRVLSVLADRELCDEEVVLVRALTKDMCGSLRFMMATYAELEQEYSEDCSTKLLKIIVEASDYAVDFVNNLNIVDSRIDQFRKKIRGFRHQIRDARLDFREAVAIRRLPRIQQRKAQDNMESFIRRSLKPVNQLPVDGGCLSGTRAKTLSSVDAWLENHDLQNVFWISGAPGTGKTALASTIITDKSRNSEHCRFFIKIRDQKLRDPRVVWRSIAYELANTYRGIKVDILEHISGGSLPKDDDIEGQFRHLILNPLKTQFSADALSTRKQLVVIDALDEFNQENPDELVTFLDTIVQWKMELPLTCRLVITSRPETEIVGKLQNASHRLVLDAGDVVSKESNADIRYFYETELQQMKGDVVGWPDSNSITKLTQAASGVFVWAKTVVEFIRHGANPVEKLKEVLTDMVGEEGGYEKDRLGKLYTQILLKTALQLRHPEEFDCLSLVLASSTLLREPVPMTAVHELFLHEYPSFNIILGGLKSLISVEGHYEGLRVRHRSFSDLLRDKPKIEQWLTNLLEGTLESKQRPILDAFIISRQHILLAEVCLRSMDRAPDINVSDTCPYEIALAYKCRHWVYHLRDAGEDGVLLAPLIETFTRKHVLHWMEVLSRSSSAYKTFRSLRRRVDRLCTLSRIESNETSDSLSAIKKVLMTIVEHVDIEVLDVVPKVFKVFEQSHLSTKTVVEVLLIPFKFLDERHELIVDAKTLIADLCTSLKLLMSAFTMLKRGLVNNSGIELFNLIVNVATYIHDLVWERGSTQMPHNTQFLNELRGFRKNLEVCRFDFREAVIIKTLIRCGAFDHPRDDMTFLNHVFRPIKKTSSTGGCLPGTRKSFLSDVETWLAAPVCTSHERSTNEVPKVLWISGFPGAGKTSFSVTIINKLLGHQCANFFVEQDSTDPREIWRCIAYQLADLDRGFKINILEVISKKPGLKYPRNATVLDQFRELICEPLKKLFADFPTLSRRFVVVIDGVEAGEDEGGFDDPAYKTEDKAQWTAFLDTIVMWHKELPSSCKVVFTSRIEAEIEKKLKPISHTIILDVGHNVSDESNRDIRHLFESALQNMLIGTDTIATLTKYAAGLFIWAITVIDFVRAGDYQERLEFVLANMTKVPGDLRRKPDNIGLLYGQILFKTAMCNELDALGLVLASLVLLRRPLPMSALQELYSPGGIMPDHSSGARLSDISRVFDGLKSVVVTGEDGLFRVRHKSFSDFLLNDHRVVSVVETFLGPTLKQPPHRSDAHILGTFTIVQQHALIARYCLRLLNKRAAISLANTSAALVYSCVHWVDHHEFRCTGQQSYADSGIKLTSSAKIYPLATVQKIALRWLEELSETRSSDFAARMLKIDYSSTLRSVFGAIEILDDQKDVETTGVAAHPIMRGILKVLSNVVIPVIDSNIVVKAMAAFATFATVRFGYQYAEYAFM
ncbi:hypothetical protein SCHPADRAFT_65910 [Schizopora paradoxa]|uniref:NACHT domain-containing protein n=1 Tax=Schizopora paradoxa TaxID=27342 RepID=A0A0H2S5P0_9AGAM|nr:hypothetical protein SCHPADRAFT_65910 [Schizopora paradoxa]